MGDDDPEIEKLVIRSSSTPDSSLHDIQIDVPEVTCNNSQVVPIQSTDRQLSDSQQSLVESESEYKHVNSLRTTPSPSSSTTKVKPRHVGKSFVSSTHYLKDQFPSPRGAFNQNSYLVKTAGNSNQEFNKYYSTVSSLSSTSKPLTPYEKKFAHLVSTRSLIPQPRAHSANSIRKLDKNVTKTMSNYTYAGDMYNISSNSMSRAQEKEELQRLNDRFSQYILKVRQLGQGRQLDSSAYLNSARVLEEEVTNLKNLYERELNNMRQQLEETSREKNNIQQHCQKYQQTAQDLEDRLLVETDKNRKLVDQINTCQQRISCLEQDLMQVKVAPRSSDDVPRMQRDMDNLTRENENFKRRWEKEQLLRQEVEERLHAFHHKIEFDQQVQNEQQTDLRQRLESATATIFGLENRVKELSKTDANIPELLKQVRESAEIELQKYQSESEQQYTRNISALKVQMENDASTIDRLEHEKSQVLGSVGDLKARITSLEGQIRMIDHQRQSLEEVLQQERSRSADQLQNMEKRFREVQEVLFVKMQEANISRDTNIPLKAEIEALKALLEDEEKRLNTPLDVGATPLPTTSYTSIATPPATQTYVTTPQLQTSNVFTTYQPPMSTSYQIQSSMYPPQPTTSYPPLMSSYPPNQADVLQLNEPYNPEQNEFDATATVEFPISATRYSYETTPSINKLQIEPSPPVTPRPVGPVVRVKSAPASGRSPVSLGQGKDYFDEMFRDLTHQTINTHSRPKSSPVERYPLAMTHDYTTATSSITDSIAIGDVKILEVNQEGKYVRLVNEGNKEVEFGGYMIQQNVGGHPVAVYRFPKRAKFTGNNTITVWSGTNDAMLHQPPTDYVWKEQQKWGTGPECTTILCKPNGQAIAWTTAAHRFTKDAFQDSKASSEVDQQLDINDDDVQVNDGDSLTEMTVNINEQKQDSVYLRRQKQQPPTLSPQKHPHGSNPGREVHPHTSQPRPFTYGNDNSSVNRQSRSQTTRPDPIPGQPYAGASAQRMGSASLRKYSPTHNIRGNGTIANKSKSSFLNYLLATPEH